MCEAFTKDSPQRQPTFAREHYAVTANFEQPGDVGFEVLQGLVTRSGEMSLRQKAKLFVGMIFVSKLYILCKYQTASVV
jgi:hypothetical protein